MKGSSPLMKRFWVCTAKDMPFNGQKDKDLDANLPVDMDSPVDFRLHCGEIVRCTPYYYGFCAVERMTWY